MKQDKELLFQRLLSVLALGAVAFLGLTTVYSSDDYAYSLYFDNGLRGYLPLAQYHYESVNGRALVHLFAHLLLEFDNVVFCLVCIGCALAIPALAQRHWALDRRDRARERSIYLLLFAAMPSAIMTQGVMWVSAFCNYVIPCVMVCALISLLLDADRRGWRTPAILLLAFLCGATTEQMGAVTLAVLALVLLGDLWERRGAFCPAAGMLLAAGGYATIFLSPSTQGRLLRETKVAAPEGLLASVWEGFRQQTVLLSTSAAPALAVTLIFLSLGRRKRWMRAASAAGIAGVWLGYFGTGAVREAGWALSYVLLAVMGLMLLRERMEMPGLLILAAVGSACIMMPTQSNRSRCFLPMYLFLAAAAALLTAKAACKRTSRSVIPAMAALLVFSAVSCYPILAGYWHNYRVDRINAVHVAEWEPGQPLYYCMDYDKRYTDSKPYDSGGAYEDFYLQSVGMDPDTTEVVYYGADHWAVYLSGSRLRFPAYTSGGTDYLPLRSIVEGAGGSVTLEGGKLLVTLDGCSFRLDYILRGETPVTWDGGSAGYACDNNVAGFYLEEAFFTEILGLRIRWSADRSELHISN